MPESIYDKFKQCQHKLNVVVLGLYGLRFLDMASSLGRHRVHVSKVLNGKRESEILKRDIAAFFGLEVMDIWPVDQAGSSDRPGEDRRGRGRDQV